AAAANAVRAGVVVVAAAGNERDKPYVVGSPSSAPGVISVAETEVPSAMVIPVVVNSPASIAGRFTNTATLPWAPITGKIQAEVAFVGGGCPTDPYLADPAGKIALVAGFSCAVSDEVLRASAAGALAVIVDFIAPGDPRTFSSSSCPEPPDGTCKPAIVV